MKKLFYSFSLLVLGSCFAQYQIPNSGFETWEFEPYEDSGHDSPIPWSPGSVCASVSVGETTEANCVVSVVQTTEAFSGNYAAKMDTGGFPLFLLLDHEVDGTALPEEVTIHVNTKGFNANDTVEITVAFHNDEYFSDDPLSIMEAKIDITEKTSDYEEYSLNIENLGGTEYDYMSVVINFRYDDYKLGSYILIDDLELTYADGVGVDAVGELDTDNTVKATVVNEELVFQNEVSSFRLFDITGNQIASDSQATYNVSNLKSGIYIVSTETLDGSQNIFKIAID